MTFERRLASAILIQALKDWTKSEYREKVMEFFRIGMV